MNRLLSRTPDLSKRTDRPPNDLQRLSESLEQIMKLLDCLANNLLPLLAEVDQRLTAIEEALKR